MFRQLTVLLAATCATAAVAQNELLEAIWNAYDSRMVNQTDKWFNDGDFPRCIQILRINHELKPFDYEITTDLGWMLGNIERPDEELQIYIEYRKAYPNYKDAALPEATFYFLKKMYDRIPAILEPKMHMKPHPNNFRILAHAYEKTGQLQKSKETWEKYIELMPGDDAAKKNLERVTKKLQEQK